MRVFRIGAGLAAIMCLTGCSMIQPKAPNVSHNFLVFFRFDSGELTGPGKDIVDQAASAAKLLKPSTIALAGYADDPGSKNYNQHLSEKRIIAVRTVLEADGIDPKLILRIPLGDSESDLGGTADRRVEIRLLTGKP